MKTRWALTRDGFTIVELTIVIVVIGILAAISIVLYGNIRDRAITSALTNDLDTVKKHMEIVKTKSSGKYPNFIPDDVRGSEGITLRLIESAPYSGLTPAQNAQLFVSTCDQLVTEGYGTGTNIWGATATYITDCQIHGGGFQVTGWHTFPGTASVGSNTLSNWYGANVTPQTGFPDKLDVHLAFATELESRHAHLGGTFPAVTTSGTATLPTPGTGYVPTEYCVEASHIKRTNLIYHVDELGEVVQGAC